MALTELVNALRQQAIKQREREGEPSADFINFVAYGAAAEFAEKYFKKSTKLVVVARCQTRTYTNNEGKKVYVTEFIVEDQERSEVRGKQEGSRRRTGNGKRRFYADAGRRRITV